MTTRKKRGGGKRALENGQRALIPLMLLDGAGTVTEGDIATNRSLLAAAARGPGPEASYPPALFDRLFGLPGRHDAPPNAEPPTPVLLPVRHRSPSPTEAVAHPEGRQAG
jgi:hypothetical protein